MMKKIKPFLPLIIGVLMLLLLVGARSIGLSSLAKAGRWPDVSGGFYGTPVMKDGVEYFVPPDELYDNGMGKDGIPALNSPSYVSVAAADDVLADEVGGIDVAVNGKHRFYSFQILNWHELVNDTFGDQELLISYSPLCGSAVVYQRVVEDGVSRTFGDNGQVYNGCAVLYDDKSSELWDQASGHNISGHDHAESLARYPSQVMTWAEWKTAYPNGEALSTETGFKRDYRRHPYGNYDNNSSLFFPVNKTDARLGVKDTVYDFLFGDTHVGASAKFMSFVKEPNYSAETKDGSLSYAVFVDQENVPHAYRRTVGDQTLTFVHDANTLTDKETGSTWNAKGECVKGKMKGKHLEEFLPSAQMFAFAYVAHYPDAPLLGGDFVKSAESNPSAATEPSSAIINVP